MDSSVVKKSVCFLLTLLILSSTILSQSRRSNERELAGTLGSSGRWKAGWFDLNNPTQFVEGDTIRIKVEGTARNILVRLLVQGQDANEPNGIVGGLIRVPANRIINVRIGNTRNNIIQISVHGGSNPFNWNLGATNGHVRIAESPLLIRR